MQVTQAAFAKQMNVSRKTVTVWKHEGRLVMTGNLIDEEATRAAFSENSGHRTKRLAGAIGRNGFGVKSNAAGSVHACKHPYLAVPGPVVSLAVLPETFAADVAIGLLPLLPEPEVRALYGRFLVAWRKATAELADEDFSPLPGKASWADHALFTDHVIEDWAELRLEAGLA